MSPKSNRITSVNEVGGLTEPNRIYTEALAGQDVFDLEALAFSRGTKPSALLSAWLVEKLEQVRRCRDIDKAEERARLRNCNFVPWSELNELDRQRYRSQRGGGDFTPWTELSLNERRQYLATLPGSERQRYLDSFSEIERQEYASDSGVPESEA